MTATDELIRDLKMWACSPRVPQSAQLVMLEAIGRLSAPTEALPQWRDPKDKPAHLPGEHHSEDVLLCMTPHSAIFGGDHGIRIGHVSCGHWRPVGGNGNFDDDVLGWMPLPEAPRSPPLAPDFNHERNEHPDTTAERFDAALDASKEEK